MKNLVIGLVIGFILGCVTMYFLKKCETEQIEVPVKIIVKVPEETIVHDTVFVPVPSKPVTKIDSIYYNKWKEVKGDYTRMDSLYKEAIAIKEYNEVIDGTKVESKLYAKTRGDLLEYQLTNRIKEQTIPIDTTLTVKIPKSPEFYFGGNALMPFNNSEMKPSIKPSLLYINKKHNKGYNFQVDFINKGFEAGVLIRF